MKHFRIIQEQKGHNVRFKIQRLWLWVIWFDYEEEDIAIDGLGSCSYPRYWNSVHEAQEFIFEHWGSPKERVVKNLTVI